MSVFYWGAEKEDRTKPTTCLLVQSVIAVAIPLVVHTSFLNALDLVSPKEIVYW
jgi:hypothetical protein